MAGLALSRWASWALLGVAAACGGKTAIDLGTAIVSTSPDDAGSRPAPTPPATVPTAPPSGPPPTPSSTPPGPPPSSTAVPPPPPSQVPPTPPAPQPPPGPLAGYVLALSAISSANFSSQPDVSAYFGANVDPTCLLGAGMGCTLSFCASSSQMPGLSAGTVTLKSSTDLVVLMPSAAPAGGVFYESTPSPMFLLPLETLYVSASGSAQFAPFSGVMSMPPDVPLDYPAPTGTLVVNAATDLTVAWSQPASSEVLFYLAGTSGTTGSQPVLTCFFPGVASKASVPGPLLQKFAASMTDGDQTIAAFFPVQRSYAASGGANIALVGLGTGVAWQTTIQ